jgi:alanine-glyoxylate transaminase/serine-glyoxylate transaminase/serine-pyruvate transaminase
MDPQFFAIVDEVQSMLRTVFGTANRLTLPVSGTGSAGMETAIVNFVEPGDTVIVVVAGVFGGRIAEAVDKIGAHAVRLEVPWGQSASLEQLKSLLREHPETRLVAVVMAETSTGVLQPLTGWAHEVHRMGALLLVDTVTSLGGMPVDVDTQEFDIVFSGTQKCLSAPPGLSPFTVSERALERLDQRATPVPSWYFDIAAFRHYWGQNRVYHHTAPISMIYGLHEALRLALEEGLNERYARHRIVAGALWAGLQAMGFELLVDPAIRLPSVTTVRIPLEVDERRVRAELLDYDGIEIAGGLGNLSGKIWRIGVMGHGARLPNMIQLLVALRQRLVNQGRDVPSGVAAAEAAYRANNRQGAK